MAPSCEEGTDWSNNWHVGAGQLGASRVGLRRMVIDPVQQAFFFPPPFCRMTAVAGQKVDHLTDTYSGTAGAGTIELTAEITVDPRGGAGSSVADRIEFYKERDAATGPTHIGDGRWWPAPVHRSTGSRTAPRATAPWVSQDLLC